MAIKRIQHLRGAKASLTGTPLKDGEIFVDKTNHKLMVGDTGATGGNFTCATDGDLTTLKNDVDANTQDIADIKTDYMQTTGGNTITANGVAISNANGKLTAVTGAKDQIIRFNASGVPTAVDLDIPFNKSATATLPVTAGTTTNVTVSGITAASDPFIVIPQWTAARTNEQTAWNKVLTVECAANALKFTLSGATATAVPFAVYWTE